MLIKNSNFKWILTWIIIFWEILRKNSVGTVMNYVVTFFFSRIWPDFTRGFSGV